MQKLFFEIFPLQVLPGGDLVDGSPPAAHLSSTFWVKKVVLREEILNPVLSDGSQTLRIGKKMIYRPLRRDSDIVLGDCSMIFRRCFDFFVEKNLKKMKCQK